MKKFLFAFMLGFSTVSFAECKHTPAFLDFAEKEDFFSSNNPGELIAKFSKQNSVSTVCATEMAKSSIPFVAKKYAIDIKKQKCLSAVSKSCPEKLKKEVLGNLTLLDQWSLWFKTNKDAPHYSLCADQELPGAAKDLLADVSEITSFMNKTDRMKVLVQNAQLSCQESSPVPVPEDSPQIKHFKDLVKKGTAAPLEDFLKFWYPNKEAERAEDPYMYQCQSGPWTTLDKFVQGAGFSKLLAQECKPDVLYSWGPQAKLDSMIKSMPDKGLWTKSPNPRDYSENATFFMTLSPVATYGYGPIGVRVKMKKNTQFGVGLMTEDSVTVRSEDKFHDFTTSKASVIESWSYGTPEFYDEIVRDLKFIQSEKRPILYSPEYTGSEGGKLPKKALAERKGLERLYYGQGQLDGHEFTEESLKKNLLQHIEMILSGKGAIIYASGSCRNRELHFRTKKPIYFNPN